MALDMTPQLSDDPWDAITARFGANAVEPDVPGQQRHLLQSAPTAPLYSPQNPLFWLGVVMVGTALGAFAASGSVRVGKAKVTAGVGED